jgi:hypothetical protein
VGITCVEFVRRVSEMSINENWKQYKAMPKSAEECQKVPNMAKDKSEWRGGMVAHVHVVV